MIKFKESFNINDFDSLEGTEKFSMIWVEPGDFIMGLVDNPPENFNEDFSIPTGHFPARISKGFWLGQYLISQIQWRAFGDLPVRNDSYIRNNHLPVYTVNWLEAMLFCKKLNIKYESIIPENYHFSLPTEMQWEYACKAGTMKDYTELGEADYWNMSKENLIQEIDKEFPNNWGFYGMLGNVREMCFDISAFNPSLEEGIVPVVNDKALDWVGNMNEDDWFPDLPSYLGFVRAIRGCHSCVYREFRMPYWHELHSLIPFVGFRVSLRPITEWDLNDPLLKKHNINILEKAV